MARKQALQPLTIVLFGLLCVLQPVTFVGPGRQPNQSHVPRRASDSFGEALQLPPEQVVQAVGQAGPRVTASDVAAAGGMGLEEARKGLVSLAAVLGAESELEVSKTGELVYRFPSDVKAALLKVSAAAAAREAWSQAKPTVFTVLRAAFGVTLFASIAIIFSAIIAISVSSSSSSSDRDRDDRDDRRRNDSFGGGGFSFGYVPRLYYGSSPFDVFYYRPHYSYDFFHPMGFLESVYSFVFGDGDPNSGREQRQLAAVAAAARRNGGVLTAEQMAPLLDPPERPSGDSYNVNESWVLPAISQLNGRPEVAKNGQIVYVFDDLQTTAGETGRGEVPDILEEEEIPFSYADRDQLTLVCLLGVANLVGAAYLGAAFADVGAEKLIGFLGAVKTFYPALLSYAVGFFAAPAIRFFNLKRINSEVRARNQYRRQWWEMLRSGAVDGKLAEARKYRQNVREISSGDAVYSTAQDVAPQRSDSDLEDFDRRLRG